MIIRLIFILPIFFINSVHAEMLAILNWETKARDSLESLKLGYDKNREEGISIIELDKNEVNYGKILLTIPVSNQLVTHHIFYNQDLSKAYITSLEGEYLHVINMNDNILRMKPVYVPGCLVQENIIFSNNNERWWLTCMGSERVIEGNAVSDTVIKTIMMPNTFPHGISLDERIDRILVASCVSPDMSNAGKTIEVIEASSGTHLKSILITRGSSNAPVEVVWKFWSDLDSMPSSLWLLKWDYKSSDFIAKEVYDFKKLSNAIMPLEIYFDRLLNKALITSADPGKLHVFDITKGLDKPRLIKDIDASGGAHHVAITRDEKIAFVQNGLLNIPGINDGSITVVNLENYEVVDSIDTFKNNGLTINSITLLPNWYNSAGHINNGNQ